MQLLLGRIVMITQKVIRLHDVDIVNLSCLQNFARALGSRDVPGRTNFAPATKGAAHANLRPDSDDQRDTDVKEPVRTQAKAAIWTADIRQATGAQDKAQ